MLLFGVLLIPCILNVFIPIIHFHLFHYTGILLMKICVMRAFLVIQAKKNILNNIVIYFRVFVRKEHIFQHNHQYQVSLISIIIIYYSLLSFSISIFFIFITMTNAIKRNYYFIFLCSLQLIFFFSNDDELLLLILGALEYLSQFPPNEDPLNDLGRFRG